MSMVANQWYDDEGDMCCWCPACGEKAYIYEEDECGKLDDGNKEYFVYCPDCGQGFYASKSYNQ